MKILGNRVLVSRIEEEEVKEGEFEKVQVQDDFLYKGKVEQIGQGEGYTAAKGEVSSFGPGTIVTEPQNEEGPLLKKGAIVLFAKYSPHTQSVTVEGEEMKVVRMEDVIAIE